MNSLSILIYLIAVVGNFTVILGVATGVAAISTLVVAAVWLFTTEAGSKTFNSTPALVKRIKKFAAITAAFGFVLCFVPDQKTMIMIAASEIGERVVQSELIKDDVYGLSKDATKLLSTYIQAETKNIVDEMNTPNRGNNNGGSN